MREQIVICGVCNGYGEYSADGYDDGEKVLCYNCNGSGRMKMTVKKVMTEVEQKTFTALPLYPSSLGERK